MTLELQGEAQRRPAVDSDHHDGNKRYNMLGFSRPLVRTADTFLDSAFD